jgi:hypothetical protein
LIDKTPANFLYLGLIAKAIPSAKIINLVRHPMDTCYAIYKALFRMGYPFSYDLESLGQYYLGYRKLMQHWHSVLPERIKSVQYEQLVEDTEIQAKEIVKFCGLEWQADCLNFHEDKAAVATASAAQVRQPVYKTSVQKWQRYADELMPLKRILEDGGLTF